GPGVGAGLVALLGVSATLGDHLVANPGEWRALATDDSPATEPALDGAAARQPADAATAPAAGGAAASQADPVPATAPAAGGAAASQADPVPAPAAGRALSRADAVAAPRMAYRRERL